MTLHEGMFVPTILQQGTSQQKKKWMKLAKSYAIVGTYAQTEMGHGKADYKTATLFTLTKCIRDQL